MAISAQRIKIIENARRRGVVEDNREGIRELSQKNSAKNSARFQRNTGGEKNTGRKCERFVPVPTDQVKQPQRFCVSVVVKLMPT